MVLLAFPAPIPPRAPGTVVFLDFTGFDAQLKAAWTQARLTPPTGAERASIRAGIAKGARTVYAAFRLSFVTTKPKGVHERVSFDRYKMPTVFGETLFCDWRNRRKSQLAEVHPRAHGALLSPKLGRAENLRRYTTGVARSVCHELGFNLGLQRYDAYGLPSIFFNPKIPTSYANTKGVQRRSVMAMGDSGMTLDDYTRLPKLSDLERTKLEYADGVAPALGLTIRETAKPHATLATAQPLTFRTLTLSKVPAVNVVGAIELRGPGDWYSFEASGGTMLTANIMNKNLTVPNPGLLDSALALHDADGTALWRSGDIYFGDDEWNKGAYQTLDSLILNYQFAKPGKRRYYLSVTTFLPSMSGGYNLLVRLAPATGALRTE